MQKLYRLLHIEKINTDCIIINKTKERMLYFEFLLFFIGIFSIIQILSYNHQNGFELLFSILLFLCLSILYLYREKICQKKIIFNREKGTIKYRSFKIDKTFRVSEVRFVSKKEFPPFKKSSIFSYKQYYIEEKDSNLKIKICKSKNNTSLDSFIKDYMNSDIETLTKLITYNRNDDLELNKKHHL